MNKFWKFEDKVSKEGTALILDGEISSETWWGDEVTPGAFRDELAKVKGDLTVHINSQGGDVFAGVAIFNALKDFNKGKVTVKVDGLAASIASVVAMAGDEIIMSPGSMMMIHNPWSIGAGSSDDLRKAADVLDQIKDAILPIYVERTGLAESYVKDLMDDETWMTAEKAVEMGFADTVQKVEKEKAGSKLENLMMTNFAFSMSATKTAMKDLINKVNNCERTTPMNENEEVQAPVETPVEAPIEEVKDEVETEIPSEATENEAPEEVQEEEKVEEEAPAEEPAEEAEAEEENAEEGEKAEEPAEEAGEEIADKIEAKIKALQDENAELKAQIETLKDSQAKAKANMSAQKALQARYTAILNMAEEADGGEVAGEKEDEKPVDTYGNALADAFKEL